MSKEFTVRRVSPGTKNYLFGFHDLVQTNATGDLALALEVDDISHPPLPGETCRSGVIYLDVSNNRATEQSNNFEAIHSTRTWNYPQGARQQWIGDTDLFVCNDRDSDGNLISVLSDARSRKVVDHYPFPIQCVQARKQLAIFQNFDRLHAVGGYGYVGGRVRGRLDDAPENDGLWVGDLRTKEKTLIIDLKTLSACDEPYPIDTGFPQYVTHGMLNPSGTRILFIHRYRVIDGGDIDRYMACNLDGSELRCLGKGFLSHFTWVDDDTVFAWGEDQRALCAFRESKYLRIPGVLQSALFAKKVMRRLRSLKYERKTEGSTCFHAAQGKAFLLMKDKFPATRQKTGVGLLTQDGHPMANPMHPHLVVNDTYPNKDGDRWLMFYDVDTNTRMDIGKFRRLFREPDLATFDWKASMSGLDPRVAKAFARDLYLFTRSGYHCDLHPRWSYDGKFVFFDSIHEGTRQIYEVEGSWL